MVSKRGKPRPIEAEKEKHRVREGEQFRERKRADKEQRS